MCVGGSLQAQVCGWEAGSARLAPKGCCLPALLPQGLHCHLPSSARGPEASARVPAAVASGQRPSSQGQQWAPEQPARDKGLSELGRGLRPWAGAVQPGRSWEGAADLVTCSSLEGGEGWGWSDTRSCPLGPSKPVSGEDWEEGVQGPAGRGWGQGLGAAEMALGAGG